MNKRKTKKLEHQNSELRAKNNELQFNIDKLKELDSEGYKRAKELIKEIEVLKDELKKEVQNLRDKQNEYQILIDDVKTIRKSLKKIKPWFYIVDKKVSKK